MKSRSIVSSGAKSRTPVSKSPMAETGLAIFVLKPSLCGGLQSMPATSLASLASLKFHAAALFLFQGSGSHMNLPELWGHMGWPARSIAVILLVMSAWSIGVMLDRWLAFNAARKQSRQFAPLVAGALREGK